MKQYQNVFLSLRPWLVALCCAVFTLAARAERPNIILIYTDDQGYGDASCLNPESKFQTPNLDRLAREGIVFTDGHSPDTVCTPSRYGLLTGRYSWRTNLKQGVFGAERTCLIEDGRMTLASLLRDHGYNTAMVGKWHLGMDFPGEKGSRDWTQPVRDMPLDKGFGYYYGIPASMNYGVLAWFEGRYAAVPPTLYTQKKPNKIALSDYRIMPPYETEPGQLEAAPDFIDIECLTRFTDKALDWLEKQAVAAKDGTPFFLYLPYTSPHKPVIPKPEFLGQGEAGAYGAFMIETDHHVGRVLDFLDRTGLAENTMVIFTSDNGPETTWKQRIEKFGHHSNGVYREGKRSIYEGGHRVPFLVRWPAGIAQPGRRDATSICQTDMLATFAEMLGVALPEDAGEDSVSFYAALRGTDAGLRRAPMVHHGANGQFAVRAGRWKLVMPREKGKRELYDLDADPSETRNVIEANPEVASKIEEALTNIVLNGRTTPGARQPNDTGWWNHLTWIDEDTFNKRAAH